MTDHIPALPGRVRRRTSLEARRVARIVRHRSPLGRLLRPTVSIIVPIYNVEDYVGACLDSIAVQTFGDYEVLVVDDGSPDGSRAITEGYASADRRIKVITRENGGLGAARNTGVAHARGRFLTFVDSDDVLPPNALRALVDSATASGSDIVVGAVERFDSLRTWRPSWVDEVHAVARRRICIEEFLPLLRNLYTWNKLFGLDFWKAQGLTFREGVAYEDQPIITQLFARAGSIDVITDVVYHYRARDDRSSISQQTASVEDLRDRIQAWRTSRDTFLPEVPRAVYEGWLQTLFDAHFHWYLTSPGTVDDTYWAELQAVVAELAAETPPAIWDATRPDKRVLIELTRQNRRADAQEFVRLESRRTDKWPATPRADGILLGLPFLGDPDLDERLFLKHPDQLFLSHSIENFHWNPEPADPGTFSMSGWAYIKKVDLATHESTVIIVLRCRRTGETHAFPSTGQAKPSFPPPGEDSWCDYSPGTFQVQVPLAKVAANASPHDVWEVLLQVTAAGFTVVEPVTQLIRSGSAGVIPAATLPDGSRLLAEWRVKEPLRFRWVPLALQVAQVRLQGRTLSGSVSGAMVGDVERLIVTGGPSDPQIPVPLTGPPTGPRSFSVDLPVGEELSVQNPVQWDVVALMVDDRRIGLTLREEVGEREDRGAAVLTVQPTRNGNLAVDECSLGGVAEKLSVSADGVLTVSGSVQGTGVESVELATRHKKTRTSGPPAKVVDGRFVAELPLLHDVFRFGAQPLPTGDHDFTLRIRVAGAEPVEAPLRMSPELNGELPVPIDTARHEGRVVRGPEGVVRISLVRPIGDARGRYHQQRLQTMPGHAGGLTRGVLFRSYFGEHATDNGVSIQKELARRGSDLPVYWAVQDYSVPVPEGGVPVITNSREWYQLLSTVSYYVDNMYQPEYHQKADGQVLVQTFHGYPFKVMGHPHWVKSQFSQAKINAYDDRARAWDYLVSPARYATPLLTRDFAYAGEVLEIGYPRNDVLQSPEAEGIRIRTRDSLGLEAGQTAVLYAPTFRDYLATEDNRAKMTDFFDFEAATRALGDDVVIMIRGHAFNARSRQRVGQLSGTVDVTDYPEVSDLFLAADAAVVDYSSLRFDFGVTGKPMVFHVPDLQRYKETRGWLFDFEPTAPGPLAVTTEEVAEHLSDLDGLRRRHEQEYARFRSDYLDLEDGLAGSRFVDAVFAPRGDA
ncbi:MAG: bifunctional glycosyltransferase/CDP-glycerol:glycerophosphate glycerophosphotransferase [Nocardioides sp.]